MRRESEPETGRDPLMPSRSPAVGYQYLLPRVARLEPLCVQSTGTTFAFRTASGPTGKMSTDCSQQRDRSARKRRFRNDLAVARALLGEEPKGIEELVVGQHFVVEVISRRATGPANTTDHVAALHLVACFDIEG